MPLLKGFSEIDEKGSLSIPSNIRKEAGLDIASPVGVRVVRIRGSMRWPYLIVHHPQNDPRLSGLEVTIMKSQGGIDEKGRLAFETRVLEETKFELNYRAEIKLAGPKQEPWVVIHNRGPSRLTTLQEKIGRLRKDRTSRKNWQVQKWDY
jgi:bifunctional DNA-binding transcriptional regulator/antitoxin component of YhaV-PrlF toxin-antitoxin module